MPTLGQTLDPAWQAFYSASALAPDEDEDGDGISNLEESHAGTNPYNPLDRFAVSTFELIADQNFIRWESAKGQKYQLESRTAPEDEWTAAPDTIEGLGGAQEVLLGDFNPSTTELRLKIAPRNQAQQEAIEAAGSHDTDGDGQPDLIEFIAGTNPFDPASQFGITHTSTGFFAKIEWLGVEGKTYQIESSLDLSLGSWQKIGNLRIGKEGAMNAYISLTETEGRFFRVSVSDSRATLNGPSFAATNILNLTPFQVEEVRRNEHTIPQLLEAPNLFRIETPEPTANITLSQNGVIEIRRTAGITPIEISYTITGDAIPDQDYEPVTGTVTFSFGQKLAHITIQPKETFPDIGPKSVTLTFHAPDDTEIIGETATVHIIRESRISVADYGAAGDGVTDDTAAIQAALTALENSTTHNTLFFPAGVYRLETRTVNPNNSTFGSWYRHLTLSGNGLLGRDIIVRGETGSTIYSVPGNVRCHILQSEAKWRSILFKDLRFEKHSTPLASINGEPSQAYAVAILKSPGRTVEKAGFESCVFNNCQGAVNTIGNGSNVWGKLKQFSMKDSQILNPYGSNTVASSTTYGGGQQIVLTPWVGTAIYTDNLFVGGSDSPDLALNPGGVPKDGSHFGSPFRLIFDSNVVMNMGVEAVFPTCDSRVANVAQPFVIPPINGPTVTATVNLEDSHFEAGQTINFRQWINNAGRDCLLTIVAVNPAGNVLELQNTGQSTEPIAGYQMNIGTPLYAQFREPTDSTITNNLIISRYKKTATGIASNARSYIARNFIQNQGIGIKFEVPVRDILGRHSKGSIAEENLIIWNTSPSDPHRTYGIYSATSDINIKNNFIQPSQTSLCAGIVTLGNANHIYSNIVSARTPIVNGYTSIQRGVGIGIGNTATNTIVWDNISHGFDVGLGPAQHSQTIPYISRGHSSYNDVLPIDPRGVSTP